MPSLTDVKDVVTIISLLVASSVALAGLNAWKKQTIARIEYDLARRIFMTVYQLREAIHVFRNPGFEDEELTAAETGLKKDNSDLDIKEVGQRKAAYRLRWNPVETALRDLLYLFTVRKHNFEKEQRSWKKRAERPLSRR